MCSDCCCCEPVFGQQLASQKIPQFASRALAGEADEEPRGMAFVAVTVAVVVVVVTVAVVVTEAVAAVAFVVG
jgi:hypothetical protein